MVQNGVALDCGPDLFAQRALPVVDVVFLALDLLLNPTDAGREDCGGSSFEDDRVVVQPNDALHHDLFLQFLAFAFFVSPGPLLFHAFRFQFLVLRARKVWTWINREAVVIEEAVETT